MVSVHGFHCNFKLYVVSGFSRIFVGDLYSSLHFVPFRMTNWGVPLGKIKGTVYPSLCSETVLEKQMYHSVILSAAKDF
jgi:hypothetical protein